MKWLVNLLLNPFLRLGEKYLDNQKDKNKLEAATTQLAYSVDASVRQVKLGFIMGRLPLFIAEMSLAIYFASIMWDSTFPTEWLTPLELPEWFKPHFHIAVASVFGIAATERVANFVGKRLR